MHQSTIMTGAAYQTTAQIKQTVQKKYIHTYWKNTVSPIMHYIIILWWDFWWHEYFHSNTGNVSNKSKVPITYNNDLPLGTNQELKSLVAQAQVKSSHLDHINIIYTIYTVVFLCRLIQMIWIAYYTFGWTGAFQHMLNTGKECFGQQVAGIRCAHQQSLYWSSMAILNNSKLGTLYWLLNVFFISITMFLIQTVVGY